MSKILFLARENKIHIFKPPCNFLFIIFDTSALWEIAQTTVHKREMIPTISSLVRIWKIRHSGPGCSFVWILRTIYFPVKHSCLHNKIVHIRPTMIKSNKINGEKKKKGKKSRRWPFIRTRKPKFGASLLLSRSGLNSFLSVEYKEINVFTHTLHLAVHPHYSVFSKLRFPVHTNLFSFENASVFESLRFGNGSLRPPAFKSSF